VVVSINFRFWHLADSLSRLAALPLSGVKQTFPGTNQLMFFYEFTHRIGTGSLITVPLKFLAQPQ
jgi:hypothetical protein